MTQAISDAKAAMANMSPQQKASLLDQVLEQQPRSEKVRTIDSALQSRIDVIEELLPEHLKGQGARLVKRAMLTFANAKPALQKCTPRSFVTCVLEAAELGLMIDNRLGYAVPYKDQAVFQPSYIGLIAVAKRTKMCRDVYGSTICENDQFEHGRSGPKSRLEHSPPIGKGEERGDVIGAYGIIKLPDKDWRYEVMDRPDLDRIRKKSKASSNGPWVTDFDQMCIKTVIRRLLKLYAEDPGLIRAIELCDVEYQGGAVPVMAGSKAAVSVLNDVIDSDAASLDNGDAEFITKAKKDIGVTDTPFPPAPDATPEPDAKPVDLVKDCTAALAEADTPARVQELREIYAGSTSVTAEQRVEIHGLCDRAHATMKADRGRGEHSPKN